MVERIWIWGVGIPLAALLLSVLHPGFVALLLAYPLQVLRLSGRMGWPAAFFNTLGKFPEAVGAVRYYTRRMGNEAPRLIEYK